MNWLNYHHLYYFWTIARLGSITKAGTELRLSQPTLSAQLRTLEEWVGSPLVDRSSGKVTLTELGKTIFDYAQDIFSKGAELNQFIQSRRENPVKPLKVGIADGVPKRLVWMVLNPVVQNDKAIRLLCHEDSTLKLISSLILNELDALICDESCQIDKSLKCNFHLLVDSGISIFGLPKLAKKYVNNFPDSLDHAPLLLPTHDSGIRIAIESYFESKNLRPQVNCEFKDSALMKTFGGSGLGLFPAPSILQSDLKESFNFDLVGQLEDVSIKYFMVTNRSKPPSDILKKLIEQAANRSVVI